MKRRLVSIIGSALLTGLIGVTFAAPASAGQAVGGGWWEYGTTITFGKHAWSHYYHAVSYHTSTSTCGYDYSKDSAGPGVWSQADTWCGATQPSAAYWSVG